MGRVMELQPWLTVAAETASISKTQDKDDWIDTSNHEACTLCIEALQVVGGSLYLERHPGCLGDLFSYLRSPQIGRLVMTRFNKMFGGEPPGEPAWMREFARGGDPMVHRQDESWPAAGVAAYNAGRGKNIQASLRAQSAKVGAGGNQPGLVQRRRTSPVRPPPSKSGKEGGGCACGGGGKCKGGSQSDSAKSSQTLESATVVPASRASRNPPGQTLAKLKADVKDALISDGLQVSDAHVEEIISRARGLYAAYVNTLGRSSEDTVTAADFLSSAMRRRP